MLFTLVTAEVFVLDITNLDAAPMVTSFPEQEVKIIPTAIDIAKLRYTLSNFVITLTEAVSSALKL